MNTCIATKFRFVITSLTTCALTAVCLTPASAKPFDADLVPGNAKWIIHIDVDALNQSTLAEHFREEYSKTFKNFRQYLEQSVGVNPRKDVSGVTMFSDTYDSHTGAVVVQGSIDQQQFTQKLNQLGNVQKSADGKIFTVTFHQDKADQKTRSDQGQTDSLNGNQQDQTKTAVFTFADGRLVIAPNQERTQSVLALLSEKHNSIAGKSSKLVPKQTTGLIVWGAAVNLDQINRKDFFFPILSQHKNIQYRMGERAQQIFEELELVASSEEVASKMKKAVEGYVSLLDVWSGENQSIKRLVSDVNVEQQGTSVDIRFEADAKTTVEALDAILDRFSMGMGMEQTASNNRAGQREESSSAEVR